MPLAGEPSTSVGCDADCPKLPRTESSIGATPCDAVSSAARARPIGSTLLPRASETQGVGVMGGISVTYGRRAERAARGEVVDWVARLLSSRPPLPPPGGGPGGLRVSSVSSQLVPV